MTRYLLDTNICIHIIKRKPVHVLQRLLELDFSEVAISSITLSELEYGVSKSAWPQKNKLALAKFLAVIAVIPYCDRAAQSYGPIQAILEKQGRPIGPLDTLIAAHAHSLNCTLVTNNTKEFDRIDTLSIQNWV